MILHVVGELDKSSKKKTDRHKPVRSELHCLHSGLLFAGGSRNVGVLLLETFDAARGVYQFLLAGEERVAIGANFNAQHFALDGRTRLESIPASAMDRYRMIVGMDTGFHDSPFCRVRSARHSQPKSGDYSRVARSRDKP